MCGLQKFERGEYFVATQRARRGSSHPIADTHVTASLKLKLTSQRIDKDPG